MSGPWEWVFLFLEYQWVLSSHFWSKPDHAFLSCSHFPLLVWREPFHVSPIPFFIVDHHVNHLPIHLVLSTIQEDVFRLKIAIWCITIHLRWFQPRMGIPWFGIAEITAAVLIDNINIFCRAIDITQRLLDVIWRSLHSKEREIDVICTVDVIQWTGAQWAWTGGTRPALGLCLSFLLWAASRSFLWLHSRSSCGRADWGWGLSWGFEPAQLWVRCMSGWFGWCTGTFLLSILLISNFLLIDITFPRAGRCGRCCGSKGKCRFAWLCGFLVFAPVHQCCQAFDGTATTVVVSTNCLLFLSNVQPYCHLKCNAFVQHLGLESWNNWSVRVFEHCSWLSGA